MISEKIKWILDHWLISSGESNGQKYSFRGFEYLFKILNSEHPNIVIQKAAQCGASEAVIAEGFYYLDTRKGNGLIVFPADHQMREFSNGRVKNAVTSNPYLLANIRSNLNVSQIQYKTNFLYCRGSQNRRQMISVDASFLTIDEVDECDPKNIVTVEKRLGAAKNPIIRKISTPTFPNRGINHYYNNSDKETWQIKCEHCNTWQTLNFFINVMVDFGGWHVPSYEEAFDPVNLDIRCWKCKGALDRFSSGEWVAEKSSVKDSEGYHIGKLFSSRISISQLWQNFKNIQNEAEFWNSDLGLPYSGHAHKLEEEDIEKCRTRSDIAPYNMASDSDDPTTMGVDVGKLIHYQIGKQRADGINQVLNFGVKKTFDEIFELLEPYKIKMVVIDGNPPNPDLLRILEDPKYVGRVRLAFFGDVKDPFKQSLNSQYNLSVNRIIFCDSLIKQYLERKVCLPKTAKMVFDGDYYSHLTAIHRIHEIDKRTGDIKVIHNNPFPGRQDHFFFASGYQRLANLLSGVEAHQFMESLL